MILPIIVYGNPILRKVSENITPEYPKLKELIADMWETLYFTDGVGLAAPQIGLNIRMFLIDSDVFTEDEPSCKGFKKVFINAKILKTSGDDWSFSEGCLSVPTIREDVLRPSKVKIQYQDENFKTFTEEYDGLRARIIQHEYDHLEGKLFIDKINMLRRKLLNKKLSNISIGKVDIHYKIKLYKPKK